MPTITELGIKSAPRKYRTLNVTVTKILYAKMLKYFEENCINRSKWFTKLIEEKIDDKRI